MQTVTTATATPTAPALSWDWYRDPRILQAEEPLFRTSWQYLGPLARLEAAGDMIVGKVSRTPVVAVRGSDGELRAFLNVCRHRGSVIVGCDRNDTRLQCPYHAWTYGLDGSLRSAPRCGPEIEAERGELGLVPLRIATFGPFVFVNLSPAGSPLDEVLGDLPQVLADVGIDLEGLRLRERFDYRVAANWKIHMENYLECYHCPVAHPGFSSVMDVAPGRYLLSAGQYRLSHKAPPRPAALNGGGAYNASGSVSAGTYHLLLPNVKVNVNPGRQNLGIGPIYPDGVDGMVGFLDYYFGADADESWIESMMVFDDGVGREDATLVEGTQSGVSGSWIERGRLIPQEELLAAFQRYIRESCASAVEELGIRLD